MCVSVVLQVKQLQEDAARLQSAYAGDKAEDIARREGEVLEAWRSLLEASEGRRVRLLDTSDKFRFFSMVRDLMLWMEDVIRLIDAQEKPRCVCVCVFYVCMPPSCICMAHTHSFI